MSIPATIRVSGSNLAVIGDTGSQFRVELPLVSTNGLTGSLTKLSDGRSYIAAGENVAITTSSSGQVIINATAGGASGPGDANVSYLVLSNTGSLTSERVLTAGSGLTSTDGGANSTFTLAIDSNIVATVSGTTFTGPVSASAGLSGSLQKIGPNLPYLLSQGSITLSTSSNGQVIISGTVPPTYTLPNAVQALTQSLSYSTDGDGTLTILHSGSTVSSYDAFFRTTELKSRWRTTTSTLTSGLIFMSGATGRSYSVDARLQAQHTSTIECAEWRMSAHMYRSGSTMVLMRMDTAVSSSNVAALSGTLSLTGGDIIVQSTGNTGSFDWGAWMRVQELGD